MIYGITISKKSSPDILRKCNGDIVLGDAIAEFAKMVAEHKKPEPKLTSRGILKALLGSR